MTSPFDALAPSYSELWTDTARGRDQRTAVWREIDGLFRAGDRILDLGCGTGDDALHFAELGIEVFGVDAAPRMVEIAQGRGVNASLVAIEDLGSDVAHALMATLGAGVEKSLDTARRVRAPHPLLAQPGLGGAGLRPAFSGVISNFGALNCVADLRPVAAKLARLVQPAGPVAICLMGRFCFTDWRHAAKRWLGHTQWRGIDVYYPTSHQIRSAFTPWFEFERSTAIARGDHQLYIFRRRPEC